MEHTYHLRIPTEQYAYIEAEFTGSLEDAVEHYAEIKRLMNPQGLPEKEFNRCLDEFINTGTVLDGVESWETMSMSQREVFQCLKKAFKRINK